ncbi:MAG: hypothetical protein KC646_16155 [Candidatus Cloacimonetes bacterium]|nr:hypothetical protein [Candidatus Cloacimonadota bacterium]
MIRILFLVLFTFALHSVSVSNSILDRAFDLIDGTEDEEAYEDSEEIQEVQATSDDLLFKFSREDDSQGWHSYLDELSKKENLTPQEEEKKQSILARFQEVLASQVSPRGEGVKFRAYKKGFVYNANEWADYGKSASTNAHREWVKQANNTIHSIPAAKVKNGYKGLSTEVLTDDPKRVAFIFELFRQISGWEGESSAINTWDSEMLTVGPGFSAIANNQYYMGRMFSLMPDKYLQKLYGAGFRVNADFTCTIVDYKTGRLLHEKAGFDSLRKNHEFLSLLVNLAQSTDSATHNGETKELRQWMYEAQFILFANCPSARFPKDYEKSLKHSSELSRAGIVAHLAHSGKISVGGALKIGGFEALKAWSLSKSPKRRHPEKARMISHHKNFYNKRPCYFSFEE